MVITQVSKQMSNRKNLSHHHVRILAELCRNLENVERRRLLLRNSQSCLVHSLKNKATREASWVPALLDVLTSFEKASKGISQNRSDMIETQDIWLIYMYMYWVIEGFPHELFVYKKGPTWILRIEIQTSFLNNLMCVFIEKDEVEMLCTSELIKDWAEFAKTLLRFV